MKRFFAALVLAPIVGAFAGLDHASGPPNRIRMSWCFSLPSMMTPPLAP